MFSKPPCFAVMLAAGTAFSCLLNGCSTPWTTNTQRNAIEQLLLSDVIERGIAAADFRPYAGKKAYLDNTYLEPQTDKAYLLGVLAMKLAQDGLILTEEAKEAELLIQPLCGVLATDYDKILIGTPSLPVPVPNTGISLVIPEISLFQKYARYGYGRFAFNILEAGTRTPVARLTGATTKATYTNWIILLIPFSTTDLSESTEPSESPGLSEPAEAETP